MFAPKPIPPVLTTLPATGFIRKPQLLRFVPFGRSTLDREIAAGRFPPGVRLSPHTRAWRVEDVKAWIDSRAV